MFASRRMFIIGALAILVLGAGARAAPVYRWQDTNGQIHYGDNPPQREPAKYRILETGTASVNGPAGLRPGERKALQRMERRKNDASLRTFRSRRRHDRKRDRKRSECAEIRRHLQKTRDKTLRKQYSNNLRRDC